MPVEVIVESAEWTQLALAVACAAGAADGSVVAVVGSSAAAGIAAGRHRGCPAFAFHCYDFRRVAVLAVLPLPLAGA